MLFLFYLFIAKPSLSNVGNNTKMKNKKLAHYFTYELITAERNKMTEKAGSPTLQAPRMFMI